MFTRKLSQKVDGIEKRIEDIETVVGMPSSFAINLFKKIEPGFNIQAMINQIYKRLEELEGKIEAKEKKPAAKKVVINKEVKETK